MKLTKPQELLVSKLSNGCRIVHVNWDGEWGAREIVGGDIYLYDPKIGASSIANFVTVRALKKKGLLSLERGTRTERVYRLSKGI